jgi:hypothetical protein
MRREAMSVYLRSSLVLLLVVGGCRKKHEIKADTRDAGDIPHEIAVSELQKHLPTADSVVCTLPKESLKPSEIKEWAIGSDRVTLKTTQDKLFPLVYGEIRALQMAQSGRTFMVMVFTTAQKDKEHYQFIWRRQESAYRALELFEALRK